MISTIFLSVIKKHKIGLLIGMLMISNTSFGGFFGGATLNVNIQIAEKDYDINENPAPDVYGKIQVNGKNYEIKLHENTYIVNVDVAIDELKNGDRIDIQLFDKDLVIDDKLATGHVIYESNQMIMESKIGDTLITFKYIP